ncbi:hypothetical protein FisN_6Lh255 [Fistulifera solaris]|uniref:Uncharacterized protein n=1 Tax=Fistulifera solaris TaxID=1519565 RepID=A0A1Z5J5W1_FISSO|nr:hypothetical protein FisN_6Lh255 [Fistulifera solaris]|eukprot:GAX09373.1 hypothetical protein FisN_6Lh255 [Fistulifera solaris]
MTYWACQETIKFLIEINPYCLLYARKDIDGYGKVAPIYLIPENGRCKLLHWIAERYPWVFQHKLCQKKPPHLKMVQYYTDGRCDAETVRAFYELYPQGLREKDKADQTSKYPLAASLSGMEEPDADLFIWMAEQFPKAVYHKPIRGYTVLHSACYNLAAKENDWESVPLKCTPNMAKICRFLISEHPRLIRQKVRGGGPLPIHELANSCNRRLVQEMVIVLLKAYPESINAKSYKWDPDLPTVPFIEKIHPLIVKEMDIDQQIDHLTQLSQDMEKAVTLLKKTSNGTQGPTRPKSNNCLFESVAGVFCSWANVQVSDVLQARQKRIQESIADVCRLLEGEDVPDEEWEEDADDGEDEDGGEAFSPEGANEEGPSSDSVEDEDDWDEDSAFESESEEEVDVSDDIDDEEEDNNESRSFGLRSQDRGFVVIQLGRSFL